MDCANGNILQTWAVVSSAAASAIAMIGVALSFRGVLKTNATNLKISNDKREQEEQTHRRAVALERGEELYKLVEEWSREVVQASTAMRICFEEKQDLVRADVETLNESLRLLRVKFLVDVYFDALELLKNDLARLHGELWEGYKQYFQGRGKWDDQQLSQIQNAFRTSALKLEQGVINELKRITQ